MQQSRDFKSVIASKAWQPRDLRPVIASEAWESRDFKPIIANKVKQSRDFKPVIANKVKQSRDLKPVIASKAWQPRDLKPVIASEAWQSGDFKPVIASKARQSRDLFPGHPEEKRNRPKNKQKNNPSSVYFLQRMKIIYKKGIRNGYAKLEEGSVCLIIPSIMQGDQAFLQKMQTLGEKLQQKADQKQKNQIFSPEGVLLFGERIPLTDLPPMKGQKQRTAFFKQELFDYANPLLQRFASELGFPPIPLTIKKVQSKRGSCTYDNRIMLNLSLVHLPTRLTQYVVAHEACHLLAKHHQPSFRSLVAKFCPHYKALRKELKNQIFIS